MFNFRLGESSLGAEFLNLVRFHQVGEHHSLQIPTLKNFSPFTKRKTVDELTVEIVRGGPGGAGV